MNIRLKFIREKLVYDVGLYKNTIKMLLEMIIFCKFEYY